LAESRSLILLRAFARAEKTSRRGDADMAIIDSQVHAYERNHPGRPWLNKMHGPPSATGAEMVAAMDAAGVDGAILVSTYTLYGFDPSYAVQCHAEHPGKFGLVAPVDSNDPAAAEFVADWARTEGAVGIRLVIMQSATKQPDDPGMNAMLTAAAKHRLPVNVLIWRHLETADALMARHADVPMIIDHLGLEQTNSPQAEPWKDLPTVLAMARHENVRIKISAACTLSREPFPFNDIWAPILRIIDAYGVERCMWGSDWTRVANATYRQSLEAFLDSPRLSESDKATLMGGAAISIYGWSPS
jgi:L-fuconolactonase